MAEVVTLLPTTKLSDRGRTAGYSFLFGGREGRREDRFYAKLKIPIRDPSNAQIVIGIRIEPNMDAAMEEKDMWSVRINSVTTTETLITIRRMDSFSGWNLPLRLDVIVFE